jgi:hypothetical protein
MNLKSFLEGNPKILKTRYDPSEEGLEDTQLKDIKRKVAGAKSIEEIRNLLTAPKVKKPTDVDDEQAELTQEIAALKKKLKWHVDRAGSGGSHTEADQLSTKIHALERKLKI